MDGNLRAMAISYHYIFHARQRIDTLQSKLNRIIYSINKQSDAKKERVLKHLATRTPHCRSLNFLRAI
jgi:hypothetical protein